MLSNKLGIAYETLCRRMKLAANKDKYEVVFGVNPPNDKDSNIIRWEINKKIPELLKKIDEENNRGKRELYCNDCKASIKKIHNLLDTHGWEKRKYLLNISTATVHDGNDPCYQGRMMAESNKKWFYEYAKAVNYFEGKSKKGIPCCRCLRDL